MVWNTNWGQTNLFLVARTNPFDERRDVADEFVWLEVDGDLASGGFGSVTAMTIENADPIAPDVNHL